MTVGPSKETLLGNLHVVDKFICLHFPVQECNIPHREVQHQDTKKACTHDLFLLLYCENVPLAYMKKKHKTKNTCKIIVNSTLV